MRIVAMIRNRKCNWITITNAIKFTQSVFRNNFRQVAHSFPLQRHLFLFIVEQIRSQEFSIGTPSFLTQMITNETNITNSILIILIILCVVQLSNSCNCIETQNLKDIMFFDPSFLCVFATSLTVISTMKLNDSTLGCCKSTQGHNF